MPLRTLWLEHQGWKQKFFTSKAPDGGLSLLQRLLGFLHSQRRRRLRRTSKLPHNSSAEELTKFLRDHSEGIGCAKFARRQSVGSTCIAHGGGPRCDVPDCGKSAQGATARRVPRARVGASGASRTAAGLAATCPTAARALRRARLRQERAGVGGIHGRVVLECAAPAHAQTSVLSLQLSTNGQEGTSSRSIS
jgi:hypothetical protein